MDAGHFWRLPVTHNGKLEAIITESDLRQHWGYLDSTKVSGAMTPDPVTITPRITAEDAARLMLQHKIGGLPVLENRKLVDDKTIKPENRKGFNQEPKPARH